MGVITHNCSVCGEVIFEGYEYEYEYPVGSGNLKTDVYGEFAAGAGKCTDCEKYFCAYCGSVQDGRCEVCWEKVGNYEGDFIPF
jgi:ribosomal protein S27E